MQVKNEDCHNTIEYFHQKTAGMLYLVQQDYSINEMDINISGIDFYTA
jgi:hypothetical protein